MRSEGDPAVRALPHSCRTSPWAPTPRSAPRCT